MGNFTAKEETDENYHLSPQNTNSEPHQIPGPREKEDDKNQNKSQSQNPMELKPDESNKNKDEKIKEEDDDELVPMVFKWSGGGKRVFITGTFNQWSKPIPMHRSGNDFSYIMNLPKTKHMFKFLVDSEWKYASDQPTNVDMSGNVSNFVDLSKFHPEIEFQDFETLKKKKRLKQQYGRHIPDMDEFSAEPPLLPSHLRHIILNKGGIDEEDSSVLPPPQHVALDHLYCTTFHENMIVLGASQRYKDKFVTTVFYSSVSPS